MTESDRDRASKDRFARNEAIFREVNERVADVKAPDEGTTDYLCECGNLDCIEEVPLTKAEYTKVRSDPATFAVVPGHALGDVESVVVETDRFQIVKKHPREAALAEATDPSG